MSQIFIGLDIGGTKIMAASADAQGRILRQERASTPLLLQDGLDLIAGMIAGLSSGYGVAAIGAAIGGPLDWQTGVVSPLHQPHWRKVPLKAWAEERYGCPFAVDVDTNVAALAEHAQAGGEIERLLYLTISTGMGGGFLIDGQIYRGTVGAHPEVGHQSIPYRAPAGAVVSCPCGSSACLEALISGNGVRRLYGKPPERLDEEEWTQVAWNLGQGLRNLATIYAPDLIVLGGGVVFGARRKLLDPAIQVMRDHLKMIPHPEVRASVLGEENVLSGATMLAIKHHEKLRNR